MTNFKYLQSLTLEELAKWLDNYGQFDGAPWTAWFNNKYCANCEPLEIEYTEAKEKLGINTLSYDLTTECAYCELHGACKFFPKITGIPHNKETIEMWLTEEAENDSETTTKLRSPAHY